MKKQNILFNLDDTLSYCNRYFNLVIDEFTDQMMSWFDLITEEDIKQKQLQLDLAAISEHGLKSIGFPSHLLVHINTFAT